MKQKSKYRRLSSYQDNRFYALSRSTVIKYDRLISMYDDTDYNLYHMYCFRKRKLSDMFKSRKAKPMYYYYDDLSLMPLSRAAIRSFYGKFK